MGNNLEPLRPTERTNFINVSIKYVAEGKPSANRGHLCTFNIFRFSWSHTVFCYFDHCFDDAIFNRIFILGLFGRILLTAD